MNESIKQNDDAYNNISNALASFDLPKIRSYQQQIQKSDISHLPGNDGLPFFGHTFSYFKDLHGFLDKQYEAYGPIFKMRSPLLNPVVMLGPEANSLIFKNEDKVFSNFLAWDSSFENLLDNNLLERDFGDHKTQRKILQQAFKRPAIEGHMEILNPVMRHGLQQWKTGKTTKLLGDLKKLMLNAGAEVFLGLSTGKETDRINNAFVDIVAGSGDPIRRKEIWFSPYARGIRGSKLLSDYIMKIIPERRESEGRDMLSVLCRLKDEDGNQLSDADIFHHIVFILFAAHDTTTSAMSSTLYQLAADQNWQEQLREEMFALNTMDVEFDHINQLPKTGYTIKEALRMYPPLAVMPRYSLKEFEFKGHRVPANTLVLASAVFTHYMPEYWSNPRKFDPLRFSPERAEDKGDFFQYIPFGGGAHKCLGLNFAEIQSKIFLFYLLTQFKVTKSVLMRRYKYNNFPLTFPTGGLPLKLERL